MKAARGAGHPDGFTLIELLVALTILAVLSLLAYRGISALLAAERRLEGSTKRIQMIDRFFSEFERDITFAAPRPVRISLTAMEPALLGAATGTQGIYRISLSQFSSSPDMPPQRISYIFSPPTISLAATANMDSTSTEKQDSVVVLDGLQSASVRFLDIDGLWSTSWPPAGRTDALPKSAEITLVLDDLGTISRLVTRP